MALSMRDTGRMIFKMVVVDSLIAKVIYTREIGKMTKCMEIMTRFSTKFNDRLVGDMG